MHERLNQLATISVARGVGFAGLAIVCMMVGFSGNPHALLKAGGLGALLVTTVLVLKARAAPQFRYRRTEVWLMLEPHERPPDDLAQRLIAAAREAALFRFARASAATSVGFLAAATLVKLIGF